MRVADRRDGDLALLDASQFGVHEQLSAASARGRRQSERKKNDMSRTVNCIKLGVPAEGLDKPPFRGELGQRVFESVSKEAWKKWLEHSKMLINEYRLDLVSEAGQRIWMTELTNYFFGDGSAAPPDFKEKA